MGEETMRRVSEFDALRAMAALGVLLFHLRPNEGWTHFGMTGVHLFLVLSGYLITNIVINHVGAPHFFRAFYARRILRIWPIYYATLGFLVVFQHYLPNAPSLRGLPYYLTFTQYTWEWPGLSGILPKPPGDTVHAFEHSWTLALEEQFYLLWPLAIALVGRKMVVPMVFAILGFGVWFKTLGYHTWILPNVFGAFAMGGLIAAMLNDKERVARFRPLLSVFFIASGVAGFAYVRWYYTTPPPSWMAPYDMYRHSLQNFAFYTLHFGIVGFVATNAGAWFLAPLRMKELSFLGEISYGLYLFHMPVYWFVNSYWIQVNEPWPMWVAKIAITFVVATLSYHYFEKPILKLKDYFPYGPSVDRTKVAEAKPPVSAIRQPRLVYGRPASNETASTR